MNNNISKELTNRFGCMVFGDKELRSRLSDEDYASFCEVKNDRKVLDISLADRIAEVMKEWAIEKGATHYTHWFQPMTGITAEKHESFIRPDREGNPIMSFSGKNLTKGESDASSFPSGGLRATFEARGYTAWDPSSYAFVKNGSLYLPTVFCSYSGDTLDCKTPLLRSMQVINSAAIRLLRIIGNNDVNKVTSMIGAEQEYFLIDREDYLKRPDLIYTGRTLFGAPAPKGQEGGFHYYGAIKPRVMEFMREVDTELWDLGIYSQTRHNEAAPSQHEVAPYFEDADSAVDHNHLTMEYLRHVAERHGLVCLLHEKPFAAVNGSGKHINWSIATDTGVNLLDPGNTPAENAQFLLFFAAVIKAVDEYSELLRLSVATASNDERLGGNEAPPVIISVYVGDVLESIVERLIAKQDCDKNETSDICLGVSSLPTIPRDQSDRNRTSPFAFTGNKFEFRMPGSSLNVAIPTTIMNTIVAEELRKFADKLENAPEEDKDMLLSRLIRHTLRDHKRIIFNGNGYSAEWSEEAAKRGLRDYKTAADIIPLSTEDKYIELFTRHGIYSETEMRSRRLISLAQYVKSVTIECSTMSQMVRRDYLPAISDFMETLYDKTVNGIGGKFEAETLNKLSAIKDSAYDALLSLEESLEAVENESDVLLQAEKVRDMLLPFMHNLRAKIDQAEAVTDSSFWRYPTYGKLMFGV